MNRKESKKRIQIDNSEEWNHKTVFRSTCSFLLVLLYFCIWVRKFEDFCSCKCLWENLVRFNFFAKQKLSCCFWSLNDVLMMLTVLFLFTWRLKRNCVLFLSKVGALFWHLLWKFDFPRDMVCYALIMRLFQAEI